MVKQSLYMVEKFVCDEIEMRLIQKIILKTEELESQSSSKKRNFIKSLVINIHHYYVHAYM